jgi:HrpA-like RNA helicase
MSATLDGEKLAAFLDAPRLSSAGRSYPVSSRALPGAPRGSDRAPNRARSNRRW